MGIYIFGYGSLINEASLAKTIGREIRLSDSDVVQVKGFKRVWNYKVKVESLLLSKIVEATYLNLVTSKDSYVNGVIIKVTKDEFEKLKLREKYYSVIEVSEKIIDKKYEKVYTFLCEDKKYIAEKGDENAVIMKKYIDMVESGCKNIGDSFLKEFIETTDSKNFEIIDGEYKFI